jgi:hypothetical protein
MQTRRTIALWIILALLCGVGIGSAQEATPTATGFVPITVDNVGQLELGYALRGACFETISPDGTMIVVENAVYEAATGQRLLDGDAVGNLDVSFFTFSPDLSLLAVTREHSLSVSEMIGHQLGPRRFSVDRVWGRAVFNADSTLIAVPGDAVRDTMTGEPIFEIMGGGEVAFSPNGRMLAVGGDAIYDTTTWQPLYMLPSDSMLQIFSPDSQKVLLTGDGVYDVATWQPLFILDEGSEYAGYLSAFSADSSLIAISNQGVYDTASWELVFEMHDFGDFSPDNHLFVLSRDGVYDAQSWIKYVDIVGSAHFSPDGTYILSSVYNDGLGHGTCFVYGYSGTNWPFRSGLIRVGEGVIWNNPPGAPVGWPLSPGYVAVLARTPDGNYFRVDNTRWVAAADVEVLFMPEGVPVENP